MDSLEPPSVLERARALLPWLSEIRRDLHRHPELGLEEHRTCSRIEELLDELGIEHTRPIETGIVGRLGSSGDGAAPTVALRADLDALPLQDAKETGYQSLVAGKMHACGHDVHTTVLLGAARLLREMEDRPAGTVKLLFQPAEETVGGAQLLIEAGALDDPAVDAVFGLHVEPKLDVGSFGLHYGQRNASSDSITLAVLGRSGHGAYPTTGVDAIVIAAQVISALQTLVSRSVDARDSVVLSFGTIRGGHQENIIANRVELGGSLRTLDPETRRDALERIGEIARGVARGLGGDVELTVEPGYVPLINEHRATEIADATCRMLVGPEHVHRAPKPNMGVEDFAFYLQKVPGCFYSLGVRNEQRGIVHPVHHERFDVDEECLAYGAAAQVLNTLSVLRGGMSEPATR